MSSVLHSVHKSLSVAPTEEHKYFCLRIRYAKHWPKTDPDCLDTAQTKLMTLCIRPCPILSYALSNVNTLEPSDCAVAYYSYALSIIVGISKIQNATIDYLMGIFSFLISNYNKNGPYNLIKSLYEVIDCNNSNFMQYCSYFMIIF